MSLVSATVIAATPRPTPTGASDPSSIGPGSLGFWVVVLLAVALFFLYRSMRKQMKRIEFDPAGTTDEERMRGHGEGGSDQRDESPSR